jgi:carbonic anhydrase
MSAGHPASVPLPKQALLTCMDPRVDVPTVIAELATSRFFPGWENKADTYVLRNAGAVATDDALRSLVMIQRLAKPPLSPLRIAVVGHEAPGTGAPGACAMTTSDDDAMNDTLEKDFGTTPPFSLEFFRASVDHGVRRSLHRVNNSLFLPSGLKVSRGFVYDTQRRNLVREVPLYPPPGL